MYEFRSKSKTHIGLFLLSELTLSFLMVVMWRDMTFYENIPSTIANSLLLFLLISYMAMNAFNHLLLIYWEIYEVS